MGDNTATETLMRPDDVADRLSVSRETVYRLARRGDLPFHRIAGAMRFSRKDVDKYIALSRRA